MRSYVEFAKIVSCTACDTGTSKKLLRDAVENIPQPGFIGNRYSKARIALAGQNPGICPPRFASRDAVYTQALRTLRDAPNANNMSQLTQVLQEFVPQWPIHGDYFPLRECGLDLNDIAYFNVVRCRTDKNSAPGKFVVKNCLSHFERWVDLVNPNVLIFLGKWAYDAARHIPESRSIPIDFMNRERSLSSIDRVENRKRVVALVAQHVG